MTARLVSTALLLLAVAACTKAPNVTCGPGTTLDGGECEAAVTSCAPGLELVHGECVVPGSTASCTPDCTGRACGDDGCGGSCGSCADGESCTAAGHCAPAGGCVPSCEGKACGDDGCGGSCGACDDPAKPFCGSAGQCVAECIPDCAGGKECGTDGCGGSCGTCSDGSTCDARGFCLPDGWTCDPARYHDLVACDCGCGAADSDCALGLPLLGCASGESCDATGACRSGLPPGWTCDPARYGDGILCDCGCGAPDPDCASSLPTVGCGEGSTCQADGTCSTCVPDCTDATCGDDGCGGSCGTCSDPGEPVCFHGRCVNACSPTPLRCLAAECGDDACGGSCGTCGAGLVCDGGSCVPVETDTSASCQLHCGTLAPSGCSCAAGCTEAGTCCADYADACTCTPDCTGKSCGSDGCGGSCGSCDASAPYCTALGACTATCTPVCGSRTCGDDGCGGSCGSCGDGASCSVRGECVPSGWTCADYAYADGETCDCGCGLADPDCANPHLPVLGCPDGVACTAQATCDMTPCDRDGECAAGRWCLGVYRAGGGAFAGQCGPPVPFGAPVGTSCEVAEDCASLVCLGGQCRHHCATDADCLSGQRCLGLPVASTAGSFEGAVGVCDRPSGSLVACSSQADCVSPEVCLPFIDPATDGPRFLCGVVDPSGVGPGGDCTTRACAAGLTCVGDAGGRVCSKACPGGAADCPGGWSCTNVVFNDHGTSTPDDDPKVPVCAP